MERIIAAHKNWQYRRLAGNRHESEDLQNELPQYSSYQWGRLSIRKIWTVSSLFVLILITIFIAGRRLGQQKLKISHCLELDVRREWRLLSPEQQKSYIAAVRCLMDETSIFHANTSYYDDFIYAHSKTGSYSHYAAAFLPWHRMYVHIYEQALRGKCGYAGSMPYWDWTLDAHDLSLSPVWSESHGFGGDGDLSDPQTLHHGRCVRNGPFANSTRAWSAVSEGHSHDVGYSPHCLSRGFMLNDAETLPQDVKLLHELVSPHYIQETLDQPDYVSFFKMFESGAHNAIPQFVRGDFLTFTAPNDPVFFLHHAQVDRLWWLWQQRDPATRLSQFHGPSEDFRHHGHESSSSTLLDILPIGGLTKDMRVQDVMETNNGILCYVY